MMNMAAGECSVTLDSYSSDVAPGIHSEAVYPHLQYCRLSYITRTAAYTTPELPTSTQEFPTSVGPLRR